MSNEMNSIAAKFASHCPPVKAADVRPDEVERVEPSLFNDTECSDISASDTNRINDFLSALDEAQDGAAELDGECPEAENIVPDEPIIEADAPDGEAELDNAAIEGNSKILDRLRD